MGTTHRGSKELADLEAFMARIINRVLHIDSNNALLRALGIDIPELDISRASFLKQMRKFDFEVKTFQEAYGMLGIVVGPANQKVVLRICM